LEVDVRDESGSVRLVWFNARPQWQSSFPVDELITAFGQAGFYGGSQMVAPDYQVGEAAAGEKFGRILPIYPLTEGLSQAIMRKVLRAALEQAAHSAPETFPQSFLSRRAMPGITAALWAVHFPEDMEARQTAHHRLVYEELFVYQTALALRRRRARERTGVAFRIGPNVDRRIRRLFPFEFTAAQDRVIDEVAADMRAPRPMNRLIQGDVGCGKTVVAVYAMLAALAERSKAHQVALMAPTEILAEQHYLTLEALLKRAHVRTALLTGSAGAPQRRTNLRRLAEGELDLVVGTHALIQGDVRFQNLALAVVDEQHRFGVRQRLALRRKGPPPDLLIMTATPIPRTLAMACFADIDVSVINRMPPGRPPVRTEVLAPARWEVAFEFARRELARGRRVFVIYPLVEEGSEQHLVSAEEGYERLRHEVFPDNDCCLLHGRMKPDEKQETMQRFRAGGYQVMAATTVVEVGIDVPEATVMIIQHAERLGLAQLHQLRGRIGRGHWPGQCFLLAEPRTPEARQRLDVLAATSDGFRIAEEDLHLRGPGQMLGTRQSGMPELRCYDFSDAEILEQAHHEAASVVEADPCLDRPEHALLRKQVVAQYGQSIVLADIG
jgi:ATP-dependent DNA helicase RecG